MNHDISNNIKLCHIRSYRITFDHIVAYRIIHKTSYHIVLFHVTISCHIISFFPRASERRVLLIVGACQTFSHIHIFSSSHPHIFTSSHLYICSSSHLVIFTSSHLLIFTSSHLHIFSSSHPHIFTSSHPHILTSSHPHIFTSFIFTSSHLLVLTSSHLHTCSSSHPHIFTHIFTSSHLHILSCPLALLPSCCLLLFYFSLEGVGQCQRDGTKRNPFARNEVRSTKN